tara:strand:+ start:2874 stop:3443 length:570 start_codon:yes stop_codon:yes gene_type:complete
VQWQRLTDNEKNDLLEVIKDDDLIGLFEPEFCVAQHRPYNFYKDCSLIVWENLKIAPPFAFDYLRSGRHIVYLDGSPTPFETLNALGRLTINAESVIDYLEFYCHYVNQRPQNILLLRNPETMPFQDSVFIDFHFDKNNYSENDIKVTRNNDNDGYIIRAPFVFSGKIDRGIATISDQGYVTIEREAPR